MRCPDCGSYNLGCIDTRESKTYPGRRTRRHKCQDCGHRFSTIEIPVEEYQDLTTIAEKWRKARGKK
jgi:transcriptional regulator NrdR family protein